MEDEQAPGVFGDSVMVCPDPVVFQRWQAAMTQAGIALLVALALFAVMVWAARPAAWPLRLACGVCAALALGGAVASFTLRARLDSAGTRVATWFAFYPQTCDGYRGGSHGPPIDPNSFVGQFAVRIVAPVERAAAIDLVAAVALIVALGLCVVALGRAARQPDATAADMTVVTADW